MEKKAKQTEDNNQRLIREAIRKIAFGRGIERIDMSPGGTTGVGTAKLIHGYVCKIHDDPSDTEYQEYSGTIDVREYPTETASPEPVTHKGVLLTGSLNYTEGILIIPTLYSDVTILTDAATYHAYVVNFSSGDVLRLYARETTSIGVTERHEINPDDGNTPDYDELQDTGNQTSSVYTPESIVSRVRKKNGKECTIVWEAEKISQSLDRSSVIQDANQIQQMINNTTITLADQKITLGDENATEPLVLGNQLAQLMLDFITECSKITTPTLMGTMPALNVPNFSLLTSKIQTFLSKTSFTK